MKLHSQAFKENIIAGGRQLKNKITYSLNGQETILIDDDIFSIKHITNGTILKSVMKVAEIELKNNIPLNTILNHQFGVKVGEEYEYINFGNFVVVESEKLEESGHYKLTCYDKMIYSMVDYEKLNISYPITIKNYLKAICDKIGVGFENINNNFANSDKLIENELYLDLGYTFRDVLDELSQVTASTICINENGNLEVRYINNTGDVIDEDVLQNINVTFKEKYGPVNSIVLSRSAESDNIYLQDEDSVNKNGLCEIKIIDNQIMNFNNRDEFLPDILGRLNGLEYYTNDFLTTGICYYELCDKYDVKIGDVLYPCVLLNNEITITQGLEESIYTEKLEETKTDYTKSDKTDRKINQTYLIVDKQNQKIESVISQNDEQNQKIAKVTQTVEELNSKISDIADITTSAEDTDAKIEINEVNRSEPIRLVVRPIGENITNLLISSNMLIDENFKLTHRTIRFHNKTTNEDFDYELPDDLFYYDSENYDEFILDYDGQSCVINKKVGINEDGTTYILETPTTIEYEFPTGDKAIVLTEGDYIVEILGYGTGYIFARLMAKNIYTTQFYTKAEVDSEISQTAQNINLSVDSKLSNYSTTTEMNSAISLKANEITSSVSENYATKTTTNQLSSRISQTAKTIELTTTDNKTSAGITIKLKNEDGTQIDSKSANITMTGLVKFNDLSTSGSTTINGSNITTGTIDASKVTVKNLNASNITSGTISTNRLSTDVITTSNFSAQKINADNITTGTISADRLDTSKINAITGTIGGWSIDTTSLSKQTNRYSFEIRTDRPENEPSLLVWDKTNNRYAWYVRPDGYMYARNCEINGYVNATSGNFTGKVTATSGKVGTWNIGSTYLYGTASTGTEWGIFPYGVSNLSYGIDYYWGNIVEGSSDERLKNNIEEIEEKFDEFYDELKPKTFYYNKGVLDEKKHIGFIAQDILVSEKKINEDLSLVHSEGKYYNLSKQEIIALNTWQIQKLKKQVEEQNKIINSLIERIEKLEKESKN